MSAFVATLEWTRPWGFAALLLPLLLFVLALRRPRPTELATGTVAVWRALAAHAEGSRARRRARRLPPSAVFLVLAALGAAAVALAGPRSVSAHAPRTFEVFVDRSPSMYLPADGARDGVTRLARGLDQARALLANTTRAGDRVTWSAWDGGAWSQPVSEPPRAWSDAPARAAGARDEEPPFEERDRPGALWVRDGPPLVFAGGEGSTARDVDLTAPRAAGRIAVGGEAVPGPVGARGTTRIDWDGERLLELEAALAPRTVHLVVPGPPHVGQALLDLALVLELWADERGFAFERVESRAASDERGDARLALELVAAAAPPLAEIVLAHDGWRATARVAALGLNSDARRATWLASDAGAPLVGWRAGRVEVAFASLGPIEGDPAPFAASWAELFDRAQRRPAGVVPLSERRAARALPTLAPTPPQAEGSGGVPRWLPTALCAACAAGLAACALLAAEAASWRSA